MHHHPVEPARGEDGMEQDDVRYYLLNSDMSVKEICDHLGFPNLSFFGKYCRRAFGLSPTEFRKQKGNK